MNDADGYYLNRDSIRFIMPSRPTGCLSVSVDKRMTNSSTANDADKRMTNSSTANDADKRITLVQRITWINELSKEVCSRRFSA